MMFFFSYNLLTTWQGRGEKAGKKKSCIEMYAGKKCFSFSYLSPFCRFGYLRFVPAHLTLSAQIITNTTTERKNAVILSAVNSTIKLVYFVFKKKII